MNRKLDEWIAINIFNAVDVRDGFVYWTKDQAWAYHLPNYTERIEYAIEILAELRPKNDNSEIVLYKDLLWTVEIISRYEDKSPLVNKILGTDQSPALALCKAAYKLYTGKEWK